MNLFDGNEATAGIAAHPVLGEIIQPTPGLARRASEYAAAGGCRRPAADPIGMGGLPDTRDELNGRLISLCERLTSAGGKDLPGKMVAEEMGLPGTRSLRLLVAYGHVHHRLRQIVGTPGSGYCWGDCRPESYMDMAAASRRMGICYLFNASLYSRKPAAVEMAQLALDLAESPNGQTPTNHADELTAWLQSANVTHTDLINAMVELFATTDSGRAALRKAGESHRGLFIQEARLSQIEDRLRGALEDLSTIRHN